MKLVPRPFTQLKNALVIDPDRVSKISAAIQSWVVCFALVVGGGWSVLTFKQLHQVDKAQEEWEELKRKNREQGVLDLNLEASQDNTLTDGAARYIKVNVMATNKGNRNMLISLNEAPPIVVSRVAFADGKRPPTFEEETSAFFYSGHEPGGRLMKHFIRVGEVYRYSTILRVKGPGIYWISFDADVNEQDREVGRSYLDIPKEQLRWSTSTFLVVR